MVDEQCQRDRKAKLKTQNDRAKFKNVVRGFSPVHDPEGSHYKKRVCLAMTGEKVCSFSCSNSYSLLTCHNEFIL